MTLKNREEIILICDVCGEQLRARVVRFRKEDGLGLRFQSKPELFCPECDKSFNFLTRFKQQYAKKKEAEKVSV